MRNVTRALVGAIVAGLVAAAVSVYAETPTEADFAACNTDAQAAMKAGTATPTTKDYMRVESARTDSAATWTTWVGPISMESSDRYVLVSFAAHVLKDVGSSSDRLLRSAHSAATPRRWCARSNI